MDELEQLKRMAGVGEYKSDLYIELPNAAYRGRVGGPTMEDRVPPKNWPNMITGEIKEDQQLNEFSEEQRLVKNFKKTYGAPMEAEFDENIGEFVVTVHGNEIWSGSAEEFGEKFKVNNRFGLEEEGAEEEEWRMAMGHDQDDPDEIIGGVEPYFDQNDEEWDSKDAYDDYMNVHGRGTRKQR